MKRLFQPVLAAFANLALREKLLVSLAAVLVALLLGWVALLQPALASRERVGQRVADAERQLELIKRLRRDYDDVSHRLKAVETRIASGGRGNLRTTLESLATQSAVKIESMEPQASPSNESYKETKVELSLKEVTLSQTVRYLHQIENADQVLSVKALRMRTRADKPQLLDVTFTVSSFEPI